ncbi:MAG: DUF2071 domain-containing protein [Ginsengibacter sp.]
MESHILLAEWNNVVMANFRVPKELLLPYVPHGTQLDFFEGETYLSLMAFMFLNTRIRNFSVPFHTDFEEVNLRFYVKSMDRGNWNNGVVFIKEIVPKPVITFVANNFFGEKYSTMKMKHSHSDTGEFLQVGYEWNFQNKWNRLSVKAAKKSLPLLPSSLEEFIADRHWAFTKYNGNKTYKYEVQRPRWKILPVISHLIDCDFGALCGEEFSFLNNARPKSVLIAKGSEIRIFRKGFLE